MLWNEVSADVLSSAKQERASGNFQGKSLSAFQSLPRRSSPALHIQAQPELKPFTAVQAELPVAAFTFKLCWIQYHHQSVAVLMRAFWPWFAAALLTLDCAAASGVVGSSGATPVTGPQQAAASALGPAAAAAFRSGTIPNDVVGQPVSSSVDLRQDRL